MRTTSGKSASRPRRGQTIADDRSSRRGCFAALGVWHISHGSTTMSSIRTYDHPHAPLLAPNLNERTRLRGSVTWSIVCEKHAEHCTPPNDYGRYPRITSAAAAFPCAVQSLLQPLCTTRESWSRAAFQCLWCTAPSLLLYLRSAAKNKTSANGARSGRCKRQRQTSRRFGHTYVPPYASVAIVYHLQ